MTINKLRLAGIATVAALIAAPLSSAQLAAVSENFEGLDQMSGSALGDVGWLVGATVFDTDGTSYLYDYFAFPAPNGSGGFSNVATGEGGPSQGAQQLVTFSDYNNADHGNGFVIDSLVFQEQTIAVGDNGVWVFSFDAKDGDLVAPSTVRAFVKTLDPGAGFATTSLAEIDMTALPATWGRFQIAVNVSDAQAGQILQFGFGTRATSFNASGIFYDNVEFARFSGGIDSVVDEDFEALDQMSPSALGDVGWLVGATVFDTDGTTYLYDYFAFPAPNGSGGFSNVASGEGGPDQGAQQLVTFSDYNNADHGNGFIIDSLVFQERTLDASDAGSWVFEFDAKEGDLVAPSTARAFVKTLDPGAGFATTSLTELDMTSIGTTWGTYQIAVHIDPSQAGQILQAGFGTRGTSFNASGALYDNVDFGPLGGEPDTDGDGIPDSADNCVTLANPGQEDSNGDGFGNRCDADINGDCIVNPIDLGLFKLEFFTAGPDTDFNSDGIVNAIDLGLLRTLFFQEPGPSASATCP